MTTTSESRYPSKADLDEATTAEAAAVAADIDGPKPMGLAAIMARAEVVRGLLARLQGPLERDEYSAPNFIAIARYLDDLDRLIVELTPPAPKDPNEDAEIIAAEALFLDRLAGLIEAAERRTA